MRTGMRRSPWVCTILRCPCHGGNTFRQLPKATHMGHWVTPLVPASKDTLCPGQPHPLPHPGRWHLLGVFCGMEPPSYDHIEPLEQTLTHSTYRGIFPFNALLLPLLPQPLEWDSIPMGTGAHYPARDEEQHRALWEEWDAPALGRDITAPPPPFAASKGNQFPP